MPLPRAIASFVVDRRWTLLPILGAITVFFAYQLRYFEIAHDPSAQLAKDNPDIIALGEFEKTFGTSEIIVIALQAPDVFTNPVLSYIQSLTEELNGSDGVESAASLASVSELRVEDGEFVATPLLETIPKETESLAALRERALAEEQWIGQVISKDGKTAAINLVNDETIQSVDDRASFVARLKALTADPPAGVTVHITGFSPLITDATFYLKRDVRNFLWLTFAIMGGLLLMIFRSWLGVLAPLIIIVASLVWTLGLFFLLGESLDLATVLMPTLIALICLSDVVHALVHHRELSAEFDDKRELTIRTMEHMTEACFMTSVTTAAGIGSLAVSQIHTIRQFGLWSCIGILIAYVLVVVLLPILLMMFAKPQPRPQAADASAKPGHIQQLLSWLLKFASRDRRWIWTGTALFLLVAGALISRIRIEAEISTYLPKSAESVVALGVVDRELSGVGNLQVVLRGEPDVFTQPWAMREVEKFHEFTAKQPNVSKVISPAFIIREIHCANHDGDPAMAVIPDNDADIAEYLFTIGASTVGERLSEILTDDYSTARIAIQLTTMNTADQLEFIERFEHYAAANLDARLAVQTTGRAKVFAQQVKALVQGQVRSLFWTITLITIMLMIHFRSLRVALVSLLPNAIPVMLPLALMGLFRIHLNVSTSMVSCLAVGLAVDNAIHFLARYRRASRDGAASHEAVRVAIQTSGPAIIFVTLIIAGGFTVYMGSSFEPNRNFGMLVAVAMIGAAVADLVLLPFLIRAFRLK